MQKVEQNPNTERSKAFTNTHVVIVPTCYANRDASDSKRHVKSQKGQFFHIRAPLRRRQLPSVSTNHSSNNGEV